MAKDKKKSEGKKAKAVEKKRKQEKKSDKKEKVRSSRAAESDDEDVDLDAVLAEYAKKQEQFLKVTEAVIEPPRPRSSAGIIASPANPNELFLFGGEMFNGATATFFNDFYVYLIDRDEWRQITSQNTPLPRSGFAWCRSAHGAQIYLFGGEFSSPKQGVFYHYNTFYRLDPASREWEKLEVKGKSPPARSGHRMISFKQYIILFGGFQDTAQQTRYLADLWIYDTQNYVWHQATLPPASQKPDARSSFSLLPHENGAVMYGGYSRVKTSVMAGKQTKGGGQAQRNTLKPMVHQDSWFLRITPPASDTPSMSGPAVRWERRKKAANLPNPARAGATMTYHKGRGIMFGGVHDVEESEEAIDSEFFNSVFAWNVERNRFFPLLLRKPRFTAKSQHPPERSSRRARGQANEEELLRNLAALETGRSIANLDAVDFISPSDEKVAADAMSVNDLRMEYPHARFNAQLAVQDDRLFIYGGTFEKGDREYTFDEMYALDLGKLDGVEELFRREPENWIGSDDEDAADDDEDEDSEEEEEEEEEEDEESLMVEDDHAGVQKKVNRYDNVDVLMQDGLGVTRGSPATLGAVPRDRSTVVSDDGLASLVASANGEDETDPITVQDNLPYPRPFESRRDFFQRTSNEWQEQLMQALRWKAIQPETLTIKEIKTKAFEMSEEKWWDSREEVTALEDEQEAAGIGEMVALSEKVESGATQRRR